MLVALDVSAQLLILNVSRYLTTLPPNLQISAGLDCRDREVMNLFSTASRIGILLCENMGRNFVACHQVAHP